jgi:transposase
MESGISRRKGSHVAMGATKDKRATFQHEIVCLDDLVPDEDLYRRLDGLVDFSFVRSAAAPYYAEAGRPSVDPIVLIKLMLVGALEGIGSMREVLRVAALRLDVRRFLGYGLGERLPVHQTISLAQTRRFVDGRLFERLFARSVALCREHDLLEGTHLSIDGFHVEANAALSSLRASLGPAPEPEKGSPGADGEPATPTSPPQLQLAPPRRGPTPRRRSSNATSVSMSDPDARLRHKPGQRPHLVHRGQVAVDPKARCVVSCLGEPATGHEGDAVATLLDRARFSVPELRSVGADQGFAAERVWADLNARDIGAYIPPTPAMLPADGEPRSESQRLALAARERCKSPAGVWAHARRMADAEGVIAEAKQEGTLARARCRGTPLFHVQVLLDFAAINCKRLLRHARAATGLAAGPAAAPASPDRRTALRGVSGEGRREERERPTASTEAIWSFSVCLN